MLYKLIYLIIFLIPLSLVRFEVVWVPLNVVEVLIYLLLLLWLVRKLFYKNGGGFNEIKKYKIWFYPIFLVLIGVTLSVWFSSELQTSAGIWKEWFIVPIVLALMIVDVVSSRDQVIKIIGALFASGFAVSVLSLFYFALGELTYDSRLKAFYLSPNYLAMYLTPILILSFCLWFFAKNKFYKIILSFGYISILIAIYLTDSYGAWLGFIGALIVLFLLNFKKISIFILKNKKTALVLLLFLILSNAFVLYVEIHNEKSRNLIYSNRSSLDSRLMIWQSGWEIIKDHPLTGIGPGAFQKHYLSYQDKFKKPYLEWAVPQPHNIFMAFYLQTTLLGFLGFIALLSVFLIRTIKKHSLLSAFLASFMIYIIIHGIIDTPYWKADLSLLFWSVIALSCIIDHLSDLQKEDNLDF